MPPRARSRTVVRYLENSDSCLASHPARDAIASREGRREEIVLFFFDEAGLKLGGRRAGKWRACCMKIQKLQYCSFPFLGLSIVFRCVAGLFVEMEEEAVSPLSLDYFVI